MQWFIVWYLTSLICVVVAYATLKNKQLKKVHPSQLIGFLSVSYFMINWYIFIWKLNEVKVVCYLGLDDLLVKYLSWAGKIKHEDAVWFLVHSN